VCAGGRVASCGLSLLWVCVSDAATQPSLDGWGDVIVVRDSDAAGMGLNSGTPVDSPR
jgi:hypothetical protein